ncbi:MAG: hypothetical protein KY395_02100 [Actinobacteria bacterium]|nr:hypothetical protein [Actinomycetota bacterium]
MQRVARVLLVSLLQLLVVASASSAGAQLPTVSTVGPPALAPEPPTPEPEPERPGATSAQSSEARPLVGTFRISAGRCSAGVSGSYFRMIQPGGSSAGPFVSNNDSPCANKSYTALRPGSDGGLVTGAYQPQAEPPFDSSGNGRSARITAPQRFYGVDFATATNPTDPQTGAKVSQPEIHVDGTKLTGDVRAFAAAWNNQHFNQGAPKPDGSTPGTTARPAGRLDPETGAFTLEWTSLIQGGPFNNFTGLWHLEGTFVSSESGGSGGAQLTGGAAASGGALSSTTGASATGTRSGGASRLAHTGLGPESLAGGILLIASFGLARLRRRVSAAVVSDG